MPPIEPDTDYIETKQVYHPETGRLLGVFSADKIPADPSELLAFVRREAKAAKRPLKKFPRDACDGWDGQRKEDWWFQVLDSGFWKHQLAAVKLLPFGMSADLNGLHDPPRVGLADDCDHQRWRDHLKELALVTTQKLRMFGLNPSSDAINALLDILKSNPKYSGTTTLVSRGSSRYRRREASYVRCIRTALEALYSAVAAQALENEIRLLQQQVPAEDAQAETAYQPVQLAEGTAPTLPGHPQTSPDPPQNSHEPRAVERQQVVMPILKSKEWTRSRWASEAGVSKNSVYEYLTGKRRLTDGNRKPMAEVLELRPEELPA